MDFVHQHYKPGDTIAAIATPLGEGGVAIIRVSGTDALAVVGKIFSKPIRGLKSHTAHYGNILDLDGRVVDNVLLLLMMGTRSYTGEDTVEIHCHGGSLITRRVLEVVLRAGAKAAMPGEFTFKAFINGKIDLAQSEAVQSLIGAKNEKMLDEAKKQLQGALSEKILLFKKELTEIAAILEAWVDFPDEGLEFAGMDEIILSLQKISGAMQSLVDTFHDGKVLQDGINMCLIGSPNVGKSSLMNALLDKDRAIVTPFAGTTRDLLEDDLRLNGLNFRLIDTAGIRENAEMIEQEGIRRSKESMKNADLILLVLDAHGGISPGDDDLLKMVPKEKTIVVWNKMDLVSEVFGQLDFPHAVSISAKMRTGLENLHSEIDRVIWKSGPPSRDELLITNIRHKEALANAVSACNNVIGGLQKGVSPEFISIDMRESLREVGKVIGTDITEDILSAIFSKFCIGK